MATLASGDSSPVAIFEDDEPAFDSIPAKAYETLLDGLKDVELAEIVTLRKVHVEIDVTWDDLCVGI